MKIALAFLVILTLSCTRSKKALHFEERFSRFANMTSDFAPTTDTERLVQSYRLAKNEREKNYKSACSSFSELEKSEVTQLELIKQLIALRKQQSCQPLAPLTGLSVPLELEQDALDYQIDHLGSSQSQELVELLLSKSKASAPTAEKMTWVDRAIEVAAKQGLSSLLDKAKKRRLQIAPRFSTDIQNSNRLAVANDFASHLNYSRAIELYAEHIHLNKGNHEEVYQGLLGVRAVNRLNRHNNTSAYLVSCEKVAEFTEALFKIKKYKKSWSTRYYDSHVFWARALWTSNDRDQAERILKRTAVKVRPFKSTEQISWILSRIEVEKSNQDAALTYLTEVDTSKLTDPELKDDIQWDRAWLLYKMKNPEAQKAFLTLSKEPKANSRLRAKFWYAKTLSDQSEREKQLNQLITEEPLSYYSILAQRELHLAFDPYVSRVTSDIDDVWTKGTKIKDVAGILATADVLIGFGENEIASRYLDRNRGLFFKATQNSFDFKLLFLDLYARASSYRSLFVAFQNLAPEEQKKMLVTAPHFVFPVPYNDLVRTAAETTGVPSEFIYSIMRQESSFNPNARSLADAFGLMQILPSIAQQLAESHKIAFNNPNRDLFLPEKNILLGARLLEKNLKRWNQSGVLAAAAYNASEEAVQLWAKRRSVEQDVLEFIEEIPYRETQLYVKLIVRNTMHYSRLLKSQPFFFEEWLLKL